jgi:hypothetical protein
VCDPGFCWQPTAGRCVRRLTDGPRLTTPYPLLSQEGILLGVSLLSRMTTAARPNLGDDPLPLLNQEGILFLVPLLAEERALPSRLARL